MNRKSTARIVLILLSLGATACAAFAYTQRSMIFIDGIAVSSDVQVVRGRPYVSLADVARYLEMNVVKSTSSYRLVRAGGSHQLRGVKGKISTDISSGPWVFKVLSLSKVQGYTRTFGMDDERLVPRENGDTLVVLRCRLKNGTRETQEVSFTENSDGNTALTDSQSHGYFPIGFDSRNSDWSSSKLLPGSAHEFAVVFSAPIKAALKDLVYSVHASGMDRTTTFRVSLAQ